MMESAQEVFEPVFYSDENGVIQEDIYYVELNEGGSQDEA